MTPSVVLHTCHVRDREWYQDAVCAEVEHFAETVRGADLATPVPTCPGWSVGDLVDHVGTVHRWAAHMVQNLAPERVRPKEIDMGKPDAPASSAALSNWLAAGAVILADAFAAVDPDAPMWAWGTDQHARFWPRRMLFETLVHHADARLSLEGAPEVAAPVAVDGIDEFLDNLPAAASFSPTVEKLRGAGETFGVSASDAACAWQITFEPDGFAWDHIDAGSTETAHMSGDAGLLLLALYGRIAPAAPAVTIMGDPAVSARWLENARI
jgi:uncharacterized protein (TIGR03083 family)